MPGRAAEERAKARGEEPLQGAPTKDSVAPGDVAGNIDFDAGTSGDDAPDDETLQARFLVPPSEDQENGHS